jgi:hypothetical protein
MDARVKPGHDSFPQFRGEASFSVSPNAGIAVPSKRIAQIVRIMSLPPIWSQKRGERL